MYLLINSIFYRNEVKNVELKQKVTQPKIQGASTCVGQSRKLQVTRTPMQANFDAASSVLSSDIDTTSFVDSDDETHTRFQLPN